MSSWPLISLPLSNGSFITYDKDTFQSAFKTFRFVTKKIHSCDLLIFFLFNFRDKISPEESNMSKLFHWYSDVNAALLDHLTNQIKETDNSGVWRQVIVLFEK